MAGHSQQRLANYCEPKNNTLTSNSKKKLTTNFMHYTTIIYIYRYLASYGN